MIIEINNKYIDKNTNSVVKVIGPCPFDPNWAEVKNESGFSYYIDVRRLKNL